MKKLYTTPKTLTQRQLVFCLLADRSEATRKESYNIINKLAISKDEYDLLISMLKYKYSDLRQNIIRLLLKQPEKQLLNTLKFLLSDKKGSIRLAGLDILLQLQKILIIKPYLILPNHIFVHLLILQLMNKS